MGPQVCVLVDAREGDPGPILASLRAQSRRPDRVVVWRSPIEAGEPDVTRLPEGATLADALDAAASDMLVLADGPLTPGAIEHHLRVLTGPVGVSIGGVILDRGAQSGGWNAVEPLELARLILDEGPPPLGTLAMTGSSLDAVGAPDESELAMTGWLVRALGRVSVRADEEPVLVIDDRPDDPWSEHPAEAALVIRALLEAFPVGALGDQGEAGNAVGLGATLARLGDLHGALSCFELAHELEGGPATAALVAEVKEAIEAGLGLAGGAEPVSPDRVSPERVSPERVSPDPAGPDPADQRRGEPRPGEGLVVALVVEDSTDGIGLSLASVADQTEPPDRVVLVGADEHEIGDDDPIERVETADQVSGAGVVWLTVGDQLEAWAVATARRLAAAGEPGTMSSRVVALDANGVPRRLVPAGRSGVLDIGGGGPERHSDEVLARVRTSEVEQ